MNGGTVVNTKIVGNKLQVDVNDRGSASVYVEITDASKCIERGDSLWWQDKSAFWTPKTRCWHDYRLKKIGEAFVVEDKKPKEPQPINPVNNEAHD